MASDELTARAGQGVCICGHPRSDHYTYLLSTNGGPMRKQERCKGCDPLVGNRETNVALDQGSYVHAMYHAADHEFASREDGHA